MPYFFLEEMNTTARECSDCPGLQIAGGHIGKKPAIANEPKERCYTIAMDPAFNFDAGATCRANCSFWYITFYQCGELWKFLDVSELGRALTRTQFVRELDITGGDEKKVGYYVGIIVSPFDELLEISIDWGVF